MFLHKILFKLGPVLSATLNLNFRISFLIFGPFFGIQGTVIVCFLLVLLLLVVLIVVRVFFSKSLIIFFNVFLSCPFSQNISVRTSPVKAWQELNQGDIYSFEQEKVLFQVIYYRHTRKNHTYLTDSQYSNIHNI